MFNQPLLSATDLHYITKASVSDTASGRTSCLSELNIIYNSWKEEFPVLLSETEYHSHSLQPHLKQVQAYFCLGIDPQCCRWGFFSKATDGTMCSGVDSASKNEYQENSWGWRRPVRKTDKLTTFIVPNVETIQEP
jgi:hypothetical protein